MPWFVTMTYTVRTVLCTCNVSGCRSIHSLSSPTRRIAVTLTAWCSVKGRARTWCRTAGTTSSSSGNIFLATACITYKEASICSHCWACWSWEYICRNTELLPTINIQSLMRSETRVRNSAKSSSSLKHPTLGNQSINQRFRNETWTYSYVIGALIKIHLNLWSRLTPGLLGFIFEKQDISNIN